MRKLLTFTVVPSSVDAALLVLRIWLSLSLFVKHGIEKLFTFPQMQTHFPNPLHIGVTAGLVFALLSDGISSLLVMFGFATRLAALFIVLNMFVVFTFMHQFSFMDGHAELVYAYFGGFLTIFIAGPGKYSLDKRFFK